MYKLYHNFEFSGSVKLIFLVKISKSENKQIILNRIEFLLESLKMKDISNITAAKLIQVQSPKVIYTEDAVTVDYEYSATSVQRSEGTVYVS